MNAVVSLHSLLSPGDNQSPREPVWRGNSERYEGNYWWRGWKLLPGNVKFSVYTKGMCVQNLLRETQTPKPPYTFTNDSINNHGHPVMPQMEHYCILPFMALTGKQANKEVKSTFRKTNLYCRIIDTQFKLHLHRDWTCLWLGLAKLKIGPWFLSSFDGFHEICWIFCTWCRFHDEIQWISCLVQISWNLADFMHEIWQISWKKQISNVKFLKHL